MRHPILLGSGLTALLVPVHLLVPEPVSVQIAALTLAVIGGAYIGFGAADGRFSILVTEFAGAVIFALAALMGLLWTPLAIPLGIMSHALWDFLHHNGMFGAKVPGWYIPLCVIVDLGVGGTLLALYLT